MQNMWLKTTALGLVFCLVSPLESMIGNKEFCSLFDLPAGRYGFHGCIIGYPDQGAAEQHSKPAKSSVYWLR